MSGDGVDASVEEKVNQEAAVNEEEEPEIEDEQSHVSAKELARQVWGDEISQWIVDGLRTIVRECDMETMTLGKARSALEESLGVKAGLLDNHKEMVEQLVREQIANRLKEEQRMAKHDKRKHKGEKRRQSEQPRLSPRSSPQSKRTTPSKRPRGVISSDTVGVDAAALPVSIAGRPITLTAKEFSTGRKGYLACETITIEKDGESFEVQCLVQCAVVRKSSSEDAAEAAGTAAVLETPVKEKPVEEAATTPVATPQAKFLQMLKEENTVSTPQAA